MGGYGSNWFCGGGGMAVTCVVANGGGTGSGATGG